MLLLAPENDYASSGTSFLASSPLIKCNSLNLIGDCGASWDEMITVTPTC